MVKTRKFLLACAPQHFRIGIIFLGIIHSKIFAHVTFRIREEEILVLRKILRT